MAKVRKSGAAQGNQVSQQTGAVLLEQHEPETEAGGNEFWKGGALSRRENFFLFVTIICSFYIFLPLFASGLRHPKLPG